MRWNVLHLAGSYRCHDLVQAAFREELSFLERQFRFLLLTAEVEKRRTLGYVGQFRFISRRNRMCGALAVTAGV